MKQNHVPHETPFTEWKNICIMYSVIYRVIPLISMNMYVVHTTYYTYFIMHATITNVRRWKRVV